MPQALPQTRRAHSQNAASTPMAQRRTSYALYANCTRAKPKPYASDLPLPFLSTLRLSLGFMQRSYEIYTPDAVFHDPIGIARGIDSIRAQFDALPKV